MQKSSMEGFTHQYEKQTETRKPDTHFPFGGDNFQIPQKSRSLQLICNKNQIKNEEDDSFSCLGTEKQTYTNPYVHFFNPNKVSGGCPRRRGSG